MKRSIAIFLQIVIVLIGMVVLAFLLWEPQVEGRNAHATQFEVYFKDPFLAYAYVASISFFAALYQAFQVLGYAGKDKLFSQPAVEALRKIKVCALAMIGFVVVGEIVFILPNGEPPGVVMGILVTFGAIVTATAAAKSERFLQNAVERKSENEITG